MISKPRYAKCIEEANTILLASQQDIFPIRIKQLIRGLMNLNIRIVPFSSVPELISSDSATDDGCTSVINGIFYICYNDTISSDGRRRWTLDDLWRPIKDASMSGKRVQRYHQNASPLEGW